MYQGIQTSANVPFPRQKDYAFSVLIEWTGRMSISSVRVYFDPDDQETEGVVEKIESANQMVDMATELKILEEDTEKANERYDGLVSEMWFAFARWVEFGYIKVAPMVQARELFHELSTRTYRQASKTLSRASSKQEYKSANSGRSPDFADSAIMLVHLARIRGQDRAAALPEHQEYKQPKAVDMFSPFDEFRKKPTGVTNMDFDFIDFDKLDSE
jgi:hypothetical protein